MLMNIHLSCRAYRSSPCC